MNAAQFGPVLVLSFALVVARRPATALTVVAVQAAMVAVLALHGGLYPEAGLILVLNAGALPWLLREPAAANPPRPRFGLPATLGAALILASLAAPLSLPLAVVVLAILSAAASRDRVVQAIGILAMQNGVALAGLDLAQPERIAVILPLIPALVWLAHRRSRGRTA